MVCRHHSNLPKFQPTQGNGSCRIDWGRMLPWPNTNHVTAACLMSGLPRRGVGSASRARRPRRIRQTRSSHPRGQPGRSKTCFYNLNQHQYSLITLDSSLNISVVWLLANSTIWPTPYHTSTPRTVPSNALMQSQACTPASCLGGSLTKQPRRLTLQFLASAKLATPCNSRSTLGRGPASRCPRSYSDAARPPRRTQDARRGRTVLSQR
jgi:hypothetical protein